MTKARMILPSQSQLMSRRCTQQQFFLRPSPTVNRVFLYCLAYALVKTGILIHALVVMSDHYHIVFTDPYGLMPEFARLLNRLVAVTLNVHYDRAENLWASTPYSAVSLETADDMLDKILYTLLNPVKAGLVRTADSWPGITTASIAFGESIVVKRPDLYFRPDGGMPEELRVTLTAPPALAHLGNDGLTKLVREETARQEAHYQQELEREGRMVLGPDRCRNVDPFDSPRTKPEKGKLNPRVAGKRKSVRREAVQRLKAFWADYRDALHRWRNGDLTAIFPYGTYGLRILAGVLCRGPTFPVFTAPTLA